MFLQLHKANCTQTHTHTHVIDTQDTMVHGLLFWEVKMFEEFNLLERTPNLFILYANSSKFIQWYPYYRHCSNCETYVHIIY